MKALPQPILEAIENLASLPGIGSRSAERLIFSLLKNESGLDQKISKSVGRLKRDIRQCQSCYHFCEGEICALCADPTRDDTVLCVVETPLDVIALERTHEFKGRYHILHGVISPLNKVGPEHLKISELTNRLRELSDLQEVVLAMSGSTEADATALYIAREIKPVFSGKISRIARGIPSGGELDYLDIGTIGRAITERREF